MDYSEENLTRIRKADAARGKGNPPRPAPPPGHFFDPVSGVMRESGLGLSNIGYFQPKDDSREKSFRHRAGVIKDQPVRPPDRHYLDKYSGDFRPIAPESEYDAVNASRERSFRQRAAIAKDRIIPQRKTRPPTYIPPDEMYVDPQTGYLMYKVHPEDGFRRMKAAEKSRQLRDGRER